jgi:hypothetical protein
MTHFNILKQEESPPPLSHPFPSRLFLLVIPRLSVTGNKRPRHALSFWFSSFRLRRAAGRGKVVGDLAPEGDEPPEGGRRQAKSPGGGGVR